MCVYMYTCMCVHRACAPEGMGDRKTSAIFAVFLSHLLSRALSKDAQSSMILMQKLAPKYSMNQKII